MRNIINPRTLVEIEQFKASCLYDQQLRILTFAEKRHE